MSLINNVVEDIRYAPGTFDTAVYKEIHNAILSSSITFVEIEGSVRAGKDVMALNCYAEYLMLCPDKYHLVTHVNMDAAKKTVYDADGFGLRYLIPHGKLVIDNNHIVFKFNDWNGMEKEVHFFGLSQYNDHEKFRGMNYGSHYANEATRQNVDGLKNARDRTIASQWRKIIYTQNPIAPSNPFYTDIEAQLEAKPSEVARIYAERERFRGVYSDIKKEYDSKEKIAVGQLVKDFLFEHKKTGIEFLNKNDSLTLRKQILYKKYEVRKDREEWLYNHYGITTKHFVFTEGKENINNVKNGLDFRYIHLTMDDNPVITEVRKAEIKAGYDPSSLHYKRDILGMRALADGAIFDNLTNDNYYYTDLPKNGLMSMGWERVIGIDYGVKNDFVVLDSFIEPRTKIVFVEDEIRFRGGQSEDKKDNDGNVIYEAERRPATNELYVEFVKDMIARRENGRYTALLYDPSARAFANTMSVHHIKCTRAINTVKMSKRTKKLDTENKDQKLFKESGGIMLVKDGIGKNKIRFNKRNCKETVLEMEGYSFDTKKLQVGIEEPLKIKDHGVDVVRYIVNTRIKSNATWLRASEKEIDLDVLLQNTKQLQGQPVQEQSEDTQPVVSGKGYCFSKF